tara:strand:- start:1255 stop:2436 length:1182 start_codon:yes stop_codon:yes gene_type:complete
MFSKFLSKFVLFVILVFSFRLEAINSKDIFVVWPYTLRGNNGEVLLKFKLSTPKRMILKVKKGNKESLEEKETPLNLNQNKVYSFKLGKQKCGDFIEYSLIDNVDSEKIFDNHILKSFECSGSRFGFKFGFMSDTQENNERHAAFAKIVQKHVEKEKLAFVLNTGDVVQNGGKEDDWVKFFKAGRPYLSKTPLVAALGNHAFYKEKNHKRSTPYHFKKYLRWLKSPRLGNLSLEFPNFSLIVFNSNFTRLRKNQEIIQWKWFEAKLKTYSEKRLPIFVAMHYPPISSSAFHLSGSANILRKRLVPLVEKYGVKAVFAGHTHLYERSLKNNVHYFIAGPTGGRFIRKTFENKEFNKVLKTNTETFSVISVTKKYIYFKTFDNKDELIDKLRIKI